METTKEGEAGLFDKILPPRLEDAGLEDCALPPDSIKEAFLRAATAVKSRAASIFTASDDDDTDDGCVQDPWPTAKEASAEVTGLSPEHNPPGPCTTGKGSGLPDIGGDGVVIGGEADADERDDELVVGLEPKDGGRACVEGLQGLEIGEDAPKSGVAGDEEYEKEDQEEKPTLTEGYA